MYCSATEILPFTFKSLLTEKGKPFIMKLSGTSAIFTEGKVFTTIVLFRL